MSVLKIKIPYTPRPKASVRGGNHVYYNPSARGMKRTRDYVARHMEKNNIEMLKGPLLVVVNFQLPAPRSLSNRKRLLQHNCPHIKRPDGDNLEKFINDCFNNLVWTDDSNIAFLWRSKTTTKEMEGCTFLYVKEIPYGVPDYLELLNDLKEHIPLELDLCGDLGVEVA